MALVSIIGSKSANSMVSLEDADTIIAAGPYSGDTWDELSDTEKEYRLILSAKYMRRVSFKGWPLHVNQAMPFPRAWPIPQQRPKYYAAVRYLPYMGTVPVVPSDAEIAAMDVIPAEIEQFQALFAYGVIHRGLLGITDPSEGPVGEPQIKELSLFNSLKVVAADKQIPLSDSSSFEALIQSEHFHLRLLIDNWVVPGFAISRRNITFQLDEVA